jgi:hypothetical protein
VPRHRSRVRRRAEAGRRGKWRARAARRPGVGCAREHRSIPQPGLRHRVAAHDSRSFLGRGERSPETTKGAPEGAPFACPIIRVRVTGGWKNRNRPTDPMIRTTRMIRTTPRIRRSRSCRTARCCSIPTSRPNCSICRTTRSCRPTIRPASHAANRSARHSATRLANRPATTSPVRRCARHPASPTTLNCHRRRPSSANCPTTHRAPMPTARRPATSCRGPGASCPTRRSCRSCCYPMSLRCSGRDPPYQVLRILWTSLGTAYAASPRTPSGCRLTVRISNAASHA